MQRDIKALVDEINLAYSAPRNDGYEYASLDFGREPDHNYQWKYTDKIFGITLVPQFNGSYWSFYYDAELDGFISQELSDGLITRDTPPIQRSESDQFVIPGDRFKDFALCHATEKLIRLEVGDTIGAFHSLIDYALLPSGETREMLKQDHLGNDVGSIPSIDLDAWINHSHIMDISSLVFVNNRFVMNRDFTDEEKARLNVYMETHTKNMRDLEVEGGTLDVKIFCVFA